MSFTIRNHYVPQWHQRLFLSPNEKEAKLYYLDLKPDQVRGGDGRLHAKRDQWRWGPANCFYEDHLYTLAFGKQATDVIEKRFFGAIDSSGSDALQKCADFDFEKHGMDCVRTLATYMDAQKLRTPKGLDFLKTISPDGTHQGALYRMGRGRAYGVRPWGLGSMRSMACRGLSEVSPVAIHAGGANG